ncbi:hypothetical protein [Aeromicrobium sp.]|uniref:hypothetical protein n=1 Tax=Aeromicrobium sp. TaxID=1871063 RepID=UPI003D6C0FFF
MSGMTAGLTPRLQSALAVVLGSVAALLMPSLSATTMDAASAVVLAALVVAMATVGLSSHVAILVARAIAPPLCTVDDAPVFLAGRVTDPVRHPIRPRAPGMA